MLFHFSDLLFCFCPRRADSDDEVESDQDVDRTPVDTGVTDDAAPSPSAAIVETEGTRGTSQQVHRIFFSHEEYLPCHLLRSNLLLSNHGFLLLPNMCVCGAQYGFDTQTVRMVVEVHWR